MVPRVMTDNGSCYKSFAFRNACKRLGLRHIRTKPYTPKTTDVIDKSLSRKWSIVVMRTGDRVAKSWA